MPIEMPRGLPFSVDTWSKSSRLKRYHFLTHAHKDHATSISQFASFPIYCSPITKQIILNYFPKIEGSVFVEMNVGEILVIDDPDYQFRVSAFDANHCPGSVMYLFEGKFGNILHTGDCRLTVDCIQCLPSKYITTNGRDPMGSLDYLFLDCTFARGPLGIPNKESAIQQVIRCIWDHPYAPIVYLACDLLGQEDILVQISRTFCSKIYINKTACSNYFQVLSVVAPDIITDDPTSRFQVSEGFPRLSERAKAKLSEAQANLQPEPLFIRPSTQWYACGEGSEKLKKSLCRMDWR